MNFVFLLTNYKVLLAVVILFGGGPELARGGGWVNHGGGILNQRSARGPRQRITPCAVQSSGMKLQWRFPTGFDVSATPSTLGNRLYFPGWDGHLYALAAHSGDLIWRLNLTHLTGVKTLSRATPVIYKHLLLVGLRGPPIVLALNRHSGSLIWMSPRLDPSPNAVITMSGTAFEGSYFVGISSLEEFLPTCCSFQGSFQKLRLKDGNVLWKTSMVPPNSQFYGVSIWGSSPSIDEKRRLVYFGTGNNYRVPDYVEECERTRANNSQLVPDPCVVDDDHEDSIMALHVDNGSVAWSKRLQGYDVWTLPCAQSAKTPNCPTIMGPDYDFGEAPILIDFQTRREFINHTFEGKGTCLVVSGQKSGVVWALDCDTGKVIWSTVAGPGGALGGASWGSCTDGERIYTNIVNGDRKNFTLFPHHNSTIGGGWVAIEARTGRIIWTTAEPHGARTFGPMSVANGVVFAGSFADSGDVYAMDALTGSILWSNSTGSNIYGGFSISNNCIYGGNGYNTNFPIGQKGVVVFSFCVPEDHDIL